MTKINPHLKPIAEAPDDRPVILYSADPSPMWNEALGASVEMGWKGDGRVPGFHTGRYGFFANDGSNGTTDFRWTHFAEVGAFLQTGYERPTHRLRYEANGYLDIVVYGVGEADCQERFAKIARARCKKSGGTWAEEAITEIGHRPGSFIEALHVGAWIEGEPVPST